MVGVLETSCIFIADMLPTSVVDYVSDDGKIGLRHWKLVVGLLVSLANVIVF